MKSDKIIDLVIQYIERQNIVTDETFLRRRMLFDMFCAAKSKVQSDFMISRIELSGNNYITSTIDKVAFSDSPKFVFFKPCSAVMNTYEYVGGEDGCTRYREAETESRYHGDNLIKTPKPIMYLKQNEYLKIDNTSIETIRINFIPVNPLDCKTFNFEFDEFPIDEALINTVFEEMFKTYQNKTQGIPKDTTSDSSNTAQSTS